MPGRRNASPGSPSPRKDAGTGRSVAAALHVNQRTLQCALGAIWIIDGLLKFQPDLFKSSFVSDVISPMAAGQPSLVASTINHTATLLSHGTTVWVALFGLIEIAIGVGLFFRRSVKPALVASFIWGAGIYLFGEGLGMVLTGQTSPLQGAPGAVCFYILLGVLVWPRVDRSDDRVPTVSSPRRRAGACWAEQDHCSPGRPSGSSRRSSGSSPSTGRPIRSRIR